MMKHDVTIFTPYSFRAGQKIRIEGSRRHGDWEVVAVGENKITLRCPISKKEFEWPIFCYLVEERDDEVWPKDS